MRMDIKAQMDEAEVVARKALLDGDISKHIEAATRYHDLAEAHLALTGIELRPQN